MPKWALFAARDGDVVRAETVLQGEDAARAWAASKLAHKFGLGEGSREDLDEAFSHCDGALLEIASRRLIGAIIDKWAVAQLGFITAIGDELDDELGEERAACGQALARLATAAHRVV